MSVKPHKHFTFILRCWQVRIDEQGHQVEWRFTIKNPISEEKHGFSNFQELSDFLRNVIESQNE